MHVGPDTYIWGLNEVLVNTSHVFSLRLFFLFFFFTFSPFVRLTVCLFVFFVAILSFQRAVLHFKRVFIPSYIFKSIEQPFMDDEDDHHHDDNDCLDDDDCHDDDHHHHKMMMTYFQLGWFRIL